MSISSDNPGRADLRLKLSLDGVWDFSFEGPGAGLSGSDHRIRTPGIWQAQFAALRNVQGVGRYRRRIDIPSDWTGRSLVLVMEGVFHKSVVMIDGVPIAIHGDGWTPIEVDLTLILDGRTSFVLGVEARTPDDRSGGRFSVSLAGKQDWYGVQGGIWKPARLEARDPVHIRELTVRTSYDLADGTVVAKGKLSRGGQGLRLIVSRNDETVALREFRAVRSEFEIQLDVPRPKAWSPDAPNLYAVVVEVIRDGAAVDAVERTVGFRRFEAKDGRFFLNGEPFFMFGALDQDWHPEEECRPPSEAFLEQRFRNAKAMGVNTLRCHVKIPDRLYFDLADRLGLVVWLDMPYAQFLAPSTRQALWRTFWQFGRRPRPSSSRLRLDPVQ